MKKLLIIGASGHGKVVADIALRMNKWQQIAFLDDNDSLIESMGIKVIGKVTDAFDKINEFAIIVAIGNNYGRGELLYQLDKSGAEIPILIHPNAVIGKNTKINQGTVVMAGTVINCCTTIGKGCIVNTGSTVDHDCIIDDYVHICPGANLAGTVNVGKNSWIGIGSVISNNTNICCDCRIGAGAVVIENINESGTYVGVPVRKLD